MPLYFDISRICAQLLRSTPTGIDRVEYNYARQIFGAGDADEAVGIITTPVSTGALPNALVEHLLDEVAVRCGMKVEAETDPVYRAAKALLEAPIDAAAKKVKHLSNQTGRVGRLAQYPLTSVVLAGRRLRQSLARGATGGTYINVSHEQLQYGKRFGWPAAAGLKSVFMVHDLIPIEFPEFCSPGADKRHASRIDTVIKHASLILANSDATKQSIEAYFASLKLSEPPPIEAIELGVEECFAPSARQFAPQAEVPYVVCVGTIEGRKNLGFLFLIWRRLLARLGENCPRLVIVGRRGWENQNATAVLDRSMALAPYLVEIADLSDAGLAALIAGASVLVAPSSAEGFDLPVVEALAVGVPAIASDIPVHREIAGGFADIVDAVDGAEWAALIEALVTPQSELQRNRRARAAAYRPMRWPDHMARARSVIASAP